MNVVTFFVNGMSMKMQLYAKVLGMHTYADRLKMKTEGDR